MFSTPRQVLISSPESRIFITLASANQGVRRSSPLEGDLDQGLTGSNVKASAVYVFIGEWSGICKAPLLLLVLGEDVPEEDDGEILSLA